MKKPPIHPYAREARMVGRLWRRYDREYAALSREPQAHVEDDVDDDYGSDVFNRIFHKIRRSEHRDYLSQRHHQNWSAFCPPLTAAKAQEIEDDLARRVAEWGREIAEREESITAFDAAEREAAK